MCSLRYHRTGKRLVRTSRIDSTDKSLRRGSKISKTLDCSSLVKLTCKECNGRGLVVETYVCLTCGGTGVVRDE